MGIQVLANLVLLKCSINVLIILYINFWQIHSQMSIHYLSQMQTTSQYITIATNTFSLQTYVAIISRQSL